ncbi:MFS transporter [Vagococcus vulneris]|uniref:MFS transporter n=1 Tax=Vagococcus vulneris TaxID=1977869 RepID=A0A429ZVH6_9ENTE|nr:MFS transporter [Vagococcus vulneris]RST97629.1 MFS transporter [Vagococcus vulneris]
MESKQVSKKYRWYILVVVGMFTFMSTLDGSIVNIALPTLSHDLSVTTNQSEWVVSIYLMAVCSFLLLFGKISDSYGKVKIFKIGAFIFIIGSFLCGIANTLPLLLLARVVQAIGASMTMATNNGIITEAFPLSERGRALGMIGSFVSLGAIAGPGIGGVILSHFHWSYIFWINVPIGLLTILIGWRLLPKSQIVKKRADIDFFGFILFSLFISLFFGAIFIGQEKGFNQPSIIISVIISICALIGFIFWEKRHSNPLIQLKLFKNTTFTISLICAVFIFITNFFSNVILPFYLQNIRGMDPKTAGFLMMVFPLIMVIGAPISGYLTDKTGPYVITLAGLFIVAASQFCFIFLTPSSPIPAFIAIMGLVGVGNAMFTAPNNTIIMSSVDNSDLGIAGSLNALARNLGMVLGISLSTTILYQSMSLKAGKKILTITSRNSEVFTFGMHITYFFSFIFCMVALGLTSYRFIRGRQINLENK